MSGSRQDNNRQNGGKQESNRLGDTTLTSRLSGDTRTFLPGDIIDGAYRLTRPLGHGGMGVVFACHHDAMDQGYAIKILSGEALDRESWARFQAEAQALAKLKHPSIVRVHNMGVADNRFPYFVMDLLDGETLDQRIGRENHLSIPAALDIFIQVADALSTAHNQGIIHRDIKPSNLMLCQGFGTNISKGATPQVKIVDFGIARLTSQGFNAQTQTATGMVFGTPYYMSPEQCQGIRADERSDIYSFGCALFETLTGQLPFAGENAFQTFMLHQTQDMPSLASQTRSASSPSYPESLEKAVEKMLAKRVTDRYQTMAQLKLDLERIRAGKSIIVHGITYSTPSAEQQSQTRTRFLEDQKNGGTDFDGDEETDLGPKSLLSPKAIVAVSIGSVALLGLTIFGVYKYFAAHDDLGTSHMQTEERDENDIITYDYSSFQSDEDKMEKRISAYIKDPATAQGYYRQGDPPSFYFPTDFFLCTVRFDNGPPIFGCGTIPIPPGKRVSIQLTNFTKNWQEILKKFRPYDLNGLDIITRDAQKTLKLIESWQLLDELCFFNSVVKAMPHNEAKYDESHLEDSDLPAIDKFTRLKTLGLCGPSLSGGAIAKMQLLNTLHTLKIKRISDLPSLLAVLPDKPNITELWLGAQELTDDQLAPLLKLKTLQTLRIRRSRLTPASLEYFKKMPALKEVILDRSWPKQIEQKFLQDLPICSFEPTTDFKRWQMFPDSQNK